VVKNKGEREPLTFCHFSKGDWSAVTLATAAASLSAALATTASASTSLLTTFLASASALATGLFAASFIFIALVSLCHIYPP